MKLLYWIPVFVSQLPLVACRLNAQPAATAEYANEEQITLAGGAVNTNEVASYYRDGHEMIEVFESQPNNRPIVHRNLTSPSNDYGENQHRKLNEGSMEVVFENACASPIFVSLVHTNAWGIETTTRDALVEVGDNLSFDGVVGNMFSIYAYTEDREKTWEGTPETSKHCLDGGRCYKDFAISGTPARYTKYLSCPGEDGQQAQKRASPSHDKFSQQQAKVSSNQWLQAHNSRRRKLHRQKGRSPVELKWNSKVARSAQRYADKLIRLSGCQIRHGYQNDKYGGENLAANWGGGKTQPSPDSVLQRWFNDEARLRYPQNGHYTQVAWRATRYLGCGEARKKYGRGYCHIQVCRYIRPGNCNVHSPRNVEKLMLEGSSPCGPKSP